MVIRGGTASTTTSIVVEGIDARAAPVRFGHAKPRGMLLTDASAPASIGRAAAGAIGQRFFAENEV